MNKKENVTISCIALFIACLPLFTVNCIGGHDCVSHLLRIESVKTALENGLPYLRVNMLYFNGQGYADSLFYPEIFLYIPALLRVLGVGINASFHIFVAICIIAGFFSAYYCAFVISKNKYTGLVFAVIFTLFKYHIFDIYTRSAVGEYTALIFLPFVIAGLYDLIFNDYARPWLLVAGMTGVILTHSITTGFCALLCLGAFFIAIKKVIKNPKIILKLVLSVLSVIMLTAFYLLPMLEMMSCTELALSSPSFDMNNEKLLLREVFSLTDPSMGIVVFLPLIIRIFLKRDKEDKMLLYADICALAGLAACLFSTGFLPWDRMMKYVYQIQFPWRLFTVAGPLIAFADAVYVTSLVKNNEKREKIMAGVILAMMAVSALWSFEKNEESYYSYSDDYFDYPPYTTEVNGGEWFPASVRDRDQLISTADTAIDDKGRELDVSRYKNTLSVEGIGSDTKYLDVPFVYYKGYAAKDDRGRRLYVDGSGRNGQVRVYPDKSAYVHIYYEGTLIQHLSVMITLVFIAGSAVYIIIKKKRKA